MRGRTVLAAITSIALSGCGSVQLPAERFFGLTVEAPMAAASPAVEVLRVFDLQPVGSVDRDYPMVVHGVEVGRRELDRWVAPVDRLVTDAFVLGLSRRGVASLVKGAADPGVEQWSLHGRILEFAEVVGETGNSARITLECWLEIEDRLMFRDEFTASEPIGAGGTAAAAEGLSRGLSRITAQVERRLREAGPMPESAPASPRR